MRCEHCGTLVEGSNGTCPLCGAPLVAQAPVFPPRQASVKRYVVPFTVIYWIVALALTVVSGALCAVYATGRHYWAIAFMGLFWLYCVLRHTILGIENWHYKILSHTWIGLACFIVAGFVLKREDVLIAWVIPLFYLANLILDCAVALYSMRRARLHLLSLWWQGLLAVAIYALCFGLRLYLWPSVVCGGLGLATCLIITLTHPREVWAQIKRAFDM